MYKAQLVQVQPIMPVVSQDMPQVSQLATLSTKLLSAVNKYMLSGILGYMTSTATINNSLNIGYVSTGSVKGGLVGLAQGTINNSFWDAGISNLANATGTGSSATIHRGAVLAYLVAALSTVHLLLIFLR